MKINYKMMLFKTLCNIVYSDFVVTSKRKVIVYTCTASVDFFIELHLMLIHLARDTIRARNEFLLVIENFNSVIKNVQLIKT